MCYWKSSLRIIALDLEMAECICKQLLEYPLIDLSANAGTPIVKITEASRSVI